MVSWLGGAGGVGGELGEESVRGQGPGRSGTCVRVGVGAALGPCCPWELPEACSEAQGGLSLK